MSALDRGLSAIAADYQYPSVATRERAQLHLLASIAESLRSDREEEDHMNSWLMFIGGWVFGSVGSVLIVSVGLCKLSARQDALEKSVRKG